MSKKKQEVKQEEQLQTVSPDQVMKMVELIWAKTWVDRGYECPCDLQQTAMLISMVDAFGKELAKLGINGFEFKLIDYPVHELTPKPENLQSIVYKGEGVETV